MAAFLALFFAALIAVSQAAPRPQSDVNSQQTASNAGASAPAAAPGATAANPGATTAANTGAATAANPGASTAANLGASTAANPGATTAANPGAASVALPAGSVALVIPSQLLGSLFPLAGATGSSTGGGGSAGSPLAAIISLIPTAINQERDRFGNAVQSLVQTNTAAIGDIIDSAAATGGKFFSNGVRLVAAWPAFFGNLLG